MSAIPVILKITQGKTATFARQTPNLDGTFGGIYAGSEVITATVWPGDSEVALITQAGSPNAWVDATTTKWQVSLIDAQSALLSPGVYRFLVTAPKAAGNTGVLFDGLLEVFSASGAVVDADLASFTYVETLLAPLKLKSVELEMVTLLKSEASDAIRKWCGQRDFNRKSYSEQYAPQQNGYVCLLQMPVNSVARIRGYLQTALNITANGPTFSSAFVQWTTTGDWYSGTLAYTGIALNSYAAGVLVSTPFLFATYLTVQALATAVAAIPGWVANVSGNLGTFGTADLAAASSGTGQGAMTDNGCELMVYSQDIPCTRLDNATGMLWVGRRDVPVYGARWGDDGGDLGESSATQAGRVRVDYNAGFDTIPQAIQLACAELVKYKILLLRRDELLKTETAQKYSYEINPAMIRALPAHVLEGISRYVIHRAS